MKQLSFLKGCVSYLLRGIQRQDTVPRAVWLTEDDASRGAQEDLRDLLFGRERRQDPLRPFYSGRNTQQYVAGIFPDSLNRLLPSTRAFNVCCPCLTLQLQRARIQRWWSCRPWGVCLKPTSTSCPSWRTSSRPCFVTVMRLDRSTCLRLNPDDSESPRSFLSFMHWSLNRRYFVCVTKLSLQNAAIRVVMEFTDSHRAVLFRSLFHQPASAVSSIPGAQLANEPTLALGQDAKPNFTPQRLFHWMQLGGLVLGHCPQQAAAPHEWCVWDITTVFDIFCPCLKISRAVTILLKALKANAMHLSCCVQVTWTLCPFCSCHVILQYFRQLLRGAESPARNSRMSR